MGAPQRRQIDEQERHDVSARLVDFIIARATRAGKTTRMLAELTGLSKTRLGNIFHKDPDKRRPVRVTEVFILLEALQIGELEAHFASELMKCTLENAPDFDDRDYKRVVDLVSEVIRDLPVKLTAAFMHIDGLEFESIRKEHGRGIQKAVIDLVVKEYQASIERRDSRPNRLISFDI